MVVVGDHLSVYCNILQMFGRCEEIQLLYLLRHIGRIWAVCKDIRCGCVSSTLGLFSRGMMMVVVVVVVAVVAVVQIQHSGIQSKKFRDSVHWYT